MVATLKSAAREITKQNSRVITAVNDEDYLHISQREIEERFRTFTKSPKEKAKLATAKSSFTGNSPEFQAKVTMAYNKAYNKGNINFNLNKLHVQGVGYYYV